MIRLLYLSLTLVLRQPTSTTNPDGPPSNSMKSPSFTSPSVSMNAPENTLLKLGCKASATTMPPIPRPAIRGVTAIPTMSSAVSPPMV